MIILNDPGLEKSFLCQSQNFSDRATAVREIGNRDKKFGKNGARPRRPQGTLAASPTNLKIWIW